MVESFAADYDGLSYTYTISIYRIASYSSIKYPMQIICISFVMTRDSVIDMNQVAEGELIPYI